VHAIGRQLQRGSKSMLDEMGFLRPAPAGDMTVPDLDHRASRAHTGMRLEWPFVFGLDHLGGRLERRIDVTVLHFHHALAHGCAANVIVKRSLFREWRLLDRPFDLQLLGCPDRVP
jgi:hypothetical protein